MATTTTINMLFLLAIIISAVIANETIDDHTPKPAQIKYNCSDPQTYEHKHLQDTAQNVRKCFNSLVRAMIGHKDNITDRNCITVDGYSATAIQNYLNATSQCSNVAAIKRKELVINLNKFVKFQNVTLGNDHYKEFYEHGGVVCVNENLVEIKNCVRNVTYRNNVTLSSHFQLSAFASLSYKQGCSDIGGIKNCIAAQFRRPLTNCTEHSVNYSNLLFDTALDVFCKEFTNSNTNQIKSSSSSSVFSGAPISIATIVLYAILT